MTEKHTEHLPCGCEFTYELDGERELLHDGKLCVGHALQQAGETLRKAGERMLDQGASI